MRNFSNKVLCRVLMAMVLISSIATTVFADGRTEQVVMEYERVRWTYDVLLTIAGQILRTS